MHLGRALREGRRKAEASASTDARSLLAQELAEAGIRDYAATHGLSYGVAAQRLKAAAHAGRTAQRDPDDT